MADSREQPFETNHHPASVGLPASALLPPCPGNHKTGESGRRPTPHPASGGDTQRSEPHPALDAGPEVAWQAAGPEMRRDSVSLFRLGSHF